MLFILGGSLQFFVLEVDVIQHQVRVSAEALLLLVVQFSSE